MLLRVYFFHFRTHHFRNSIVFIKKAPKMESWQSLLERFLRDECTERENKIVYLALRDGLIDDAFSQAIDSAMNDKETAEYIDRMKPVSEDVLANVRSRMKKRKAKPAGQRRIIPEWLKITAAVVITLSVSWLVFHTQTEKELSPAMNTITVPAGQTVNLTLADGTGIWLNSRTVLKYPGVFTGDQREVILDGEGFFEVAHNRETPFVVHTGGYDIRVLGTQFNVEAYSQSGDFTISLLDGSVRVTSINDTSQNVTLQTNTMVRLQDGKLIAGVITDFNHYRWREGLISFKDTPFPDLMAKFEKCYGIKIAVKNNRVKNYAPTGKFRQSDGIDYALRVLQRDFRFRFEHDEDNHVIYIK
jgi:ferric-dicitrate binding protein FerR (iron transport regulator)